MTNRRFGGLVFALAIAGMSHAAGATTWKVICQGEPATTTLQTQVGMSTVNATFDDPGTLTSPDALGVLLGTPAQQSESAVLSADFSGLTLQSGDVVEVNGICLQIAEIRTSNLTITGHAGNTAIAAGPPGSAPVDGVNNQFVVSGAQGVTFNSILFGSGSGEVSLSTAGFPYAQAALLTVVNGASVVLENSEIAGSPDSGLFASGNSQVTLLSSLVTDNGSGNTTQNANIGIVASDASAVTLGASTASGVTTDAYPAIVSNNAGDGIRVADGSAVTVFAGTISGNGASQLFIGGASAGRLIGNETNLVTISAPTSNAFNAIDLHGASALLSEEGASITGGTSGTATAISATGGSAMLLQGSLISGGIVTVEATGGSLVELAGGNSICNGTLTVGAGSPVCTLPGTYPNSDAAIEIDHVSALNDVGGNILDYGFSPATDVVTGNGVLQLQSTADLGAGLVSGAASLSWTTGNASINASQNSSLRIEGGVAITGSVSLAQGSNGFVNASKSPGVANTIHGSIYCPFTSVAASHLSISGTTLTVTPTPPTLATSYTSASPTGSAGPGGPNTEGTCLTF